MQIAEGTAARYAQTERRVSRRTYATQILLVLLQAFSFCAAEMITEKKQGAFAGASRDFGHLGCSNDCQNRVQEAVENAGLHRKLQRKAQ